MITKYSGLARHDVFVLTLPGKYGPREVLVYRNPTREDFREIHKRFREEFPDAPPGEPKTRHTFDADNNEYVWMSGDAMHFSVEDLLWSRYGVKTHQQKGWIPDWKFDTGGVK